MPFPTVTAFTWGTKAFGPSSVGSGLGGCDRRHCCAANLAQCWQYLWLTFGADSLAENTAVVTRPCRLHRAHDVHQLRALTSRPRPERVARVQYLAAVVSSSSRCSSVRRLRARRLRYAGAELVQSVRLRLIDRFHEAICSRSSSTGLGHLPRHQRGDDRRDRRRDDCVLSTVILVATYTLVPSLHWRTAVRRQRPRLANETSRTTSSPPLGDSCWDPGPGLLLLAIVISAARRRRRRACRRRAARSRWARTRPCPRDSPRCTRSIDAIGLDSRHGVVSIVYYVGLTIISGQLPGRLDPLLGLFIAFYYSIVAFACVRYFRRQIFTSTRNFFFLGCSRCSADSC